MSLNCKERYIQRHNFWRSRLFVGRYMSAYIAAILLALGSPFGISARAQTERKTEYLEEYEAYNQALSSHNLEGARIHVRAAWLAAEEALGDHKFTALLAFSYGQLAYVSEPSKALPALRRAQQLKAEGLADLPESELTLCLAYAEFNTNNQNRRTTQALRKALWRHREQGENVRPEDYVLWLTLGQAQHKLSFFRESIESLDIAEEIFSGFDLENDSVLASMLLMRGYAKLEATAPITEAGARDAYNDLDRALHLLPPQRDVESFDPLFAEVIAWHAAAKAVIKSLNLDAAVKSAPRPYFISSIGEPSDCGFEWQQRQPTEYPGLAEKRGYIGATVIVYDFDENFRVKNPRILTEIPSEVFGEHSLKSMANWKLVAPPKNHPGCRQNIIAKFTYVLPD